MELAPNGPNLVERAARLSHPREEAAREGRSAMTWTHLRIDSETKERIRKCAEAEGRAPADYVRELFRIIKPAKPRKPISIKL